MGHRGAIGPLVVGRCSGSLVFGRSVFGRWSLVLVLGLGSVAFGVLVLCIGPLVFGRWSLV